MNPKLNRDTMDYTWNSTNENIRDEVDFTTYWDALYAASCITHRDTSAVTDRTTHLATRLITEEIR